MKNALLIAFVLIVTLYLFILCLKRRQIDFVLFRPQFAIVSLLLVSISMDFGECISNFSAAFCKLYLTFEQVLMEHRIIESAGTEGAVCHPGNVVRFV